MRQMAMSNLRESLRTSIIQLWPRYQRAKFAAFFANLFLTGDGNEEKELLLLRFWLRRDSIFFDIGANDGLYTYVAQLYTDIKNIHTFEPIPELGLRLESLFPLAKHFKLALSSSIDTHKFKIPTIGHREYKSRGTLNTTFLEDHEISARIIDVKTTTIDKFCETYEINRIDFIKIDVEGHERSVIQGGAQTLMRLRPVLQIEIEQRHHDEDIIHFIDYVDGLGYVCHYLDSDAKRLLPCTDDPSRIQDRALFKRPGYVNNFIFLPDTGEWRERLQFINRELSEM